MNDILKPIDKYCGVDVGIKIGFYKAKNNQEVSEIVTQINEDIKKYIASKYSVFDLEIKVIEIRDSVKLEIYKELEDGK